MSEHSHSRSVYDQHFFSYTSTISRKSAEAIVPVVRDLLPGINSVVDFGCAQGVWLKCWQDNGVEDLFGLDGNYVDQNKLVIPRGAFKATDLNKPIDLGRKFDLAYSFEVAEHLRPEFSNVFVESLVRHAKLILFSAAPPGQGGESHINERSFEIWRAFFKNHGFFPYDCIRSHIKSMNDIAFWYRYNIILYVHKDLETALPDTIKVTRVSDNAIIPDVSPLPFRIRKFLVRLLPYSFQNALARAKATFIRQRYNRG